jgi:hypothetical protein
MYLGKAHQVNEDAVEGAVRMLLGAPETLRRMSLSALSIVDGMGVARVADAMAVIRW